MKVTYRLFNSNDFNSGIKKLATHAEFKNFKTIYKVAKIVKGFNEELPTYNEVRQKIISKHGELQEDNKSYIIKEPNREGYDKEISEFLDTEFEINQPKLDDKELITVLLTPNEVMALEPILNMGE